MLATIMTASSTCLPMRRSAPADGGLSDPVIDIDLTPNRPDCTGVSGIARDLRRDRHRHLKNKSPKPVKGTFPCPVKVTLDFGKTPSLCPVFGRVLSAM